MDSDDCSVETQAEKLFMEGVELERNYRHYDAIKYYRKALQLVPDIDTRLYKKNKLTDNKNTESIEHVGNQDNEGECDVNDDYDGSEPLNHRIQRLLEKSDKIISSNRPQQGLHLSDLPSEIIMFIFKWVVSDELDLRSLDQCALVCRGFYLYARDPHLWKSACQRIWKNETLDLMNYESWREMYINRPHINTNGCYISETKYYRQGDLSFQGQNYRPYHLIVYYRYLRFFADGKVLMLITPDTPINIVGQLYTKNSKIGSFLRGSYEIIDDHIYVVFGLEEIQRRNAKSSKKSQYVNFIYNMEFQIKKCKKWKTKLIWKKYTLSDTNINFEQNFTIEDNAFPPLWFSRVKSYTAESERPLM